MDEIFFFSTQVWSRWRDQTRIWRLPLRDPSQVLWAEPGQNITNAKIGSEKIEKYKHSIIDDHWIALTALPAIKYKLQHITKTTIKHITFWQ